MRVKELTKQRKDLCLETKMRVTRARSFAKALSYRIWGTLSSVAVAYVITKNAVLSVTIAFWETVVKIFIYYAHERGWNYIQWGRK
jgi:uncharacterized membrane protein